MTKYKEIFKLKELLENTSIPFDFIEGWGYNAEETAELKKICPDLIDRYQICYPVFAEPYRKISVIEGFGTYGSEEDKLEVMGLLTPEESERDVVVGWLTAEEVFNRIKDDWEMKNNTQGGISNE